MSQSAPRIIAFGDNVVDCYRDRQLMYPGGNSVNARADVLLDAGLDRAAQGSRQVLVLPFILNAAGQNLLRIDIRAARHDGDFKACVLVEALGLGNVVTGKLRLRHPLQLKLHGFGKCPA